MYFTYRSIHILQQYNALVCECVLPVYSRAGDTECYSKVNGGPVRSWFSTVTALVVPRYSLHLLQCFTVLLLSSTQIYTARRYGAAALPLSQTHTYSIIIIHVHSDIGPYSSTAHRSERSECMERCVNE